MDSRDNIYRYLLGLLGEGESARVEERMILDSDFFEQVRIFEDELIEEYLDGSLVDAEKERFVTYFLATPQQLQKLKRAQAIKRYFSESAFDERERAGVTASPHRLGSWWSRTFLRTRTTPAA